MLDRHLWRDFVAVTSSVAVLGVGVGSTLPLTALLLTARGLGPEVVGWMTAAVAVGGIVGTFSAPPATLRFGRRRVMLVGVMTAALAVISLQFVASLWMWAALRALFGIAMAPLFVIGEAWINSLPGDAARGRVVAIYTTSFTLCQVIGPVLTDALTRVPNQAFLICGAIFLLGIPGIALARDKAPEPGAGSGPAAQAVVWVFPVSRTLSILVMAKLLGEVINASDLIGCDVYIEKEFRASSAKLNRERFIFPGGRLRHLPW